jgi:hypothetical protein
MSCGVQGLRRTAAAFLVAIFISVTLASCGSYSSPSSQSSNTSGLNFRAFVSNPLTSVSGVTIPTLEIIDASKDVLASHLVNVSSVNSNPGLMVVSDNKKISLVYNGSNNSIALIDNALEAPLLGSGGTALPALALPDFSESMVISADNTEVFAAVRNARVTGQPPGVVEVISLLTASTTDQLAVPNVHWLSQSHNGNRILAFGDNQDTVTVIVPSDVGTAQDATTTFCQDGLPKPDPSQCDLNAPKVFDHPVWGVFDSSDAKAYILNCGPECGGTTASIAVLDLNTSKASAAVPLAAATIGLLNGSTLYVAGTPPNTACGSGTAATTCGTVQAVDVDTLVASQPVLITDGYHHRMEMGSNGQLFIGARACSDINISGGEVRGCLSVFNTATSAAVIPPETGDVAGVTGLQPITKRNVVYVVEGGELHIYDTTTDQLQSTQIDLIGQAVDVKLVDF